MNYYFYYVTVVKTVILKVLSNPAIHFPWRPFVSTHNVTDKEKPRVMKSLERLLFISVLCQFRLRVCHRICFFNDPLFFCKLC